MEQNQWKSRAFGATVIILFLIAVVLFSTYIFRSRDKQVSVGLKRSLDVISSEENYGPLTYVSTAEESGAVNYTDEKYSYWFNSDNLLISRVPLKASEGEITELDVNEALLLAVSTLDIYLENTAFKANGWETTVSSTDSPNVPWICTFAFIDSEGVITKRHKVEIDAFGQTGFVSISEEERSVEKVVITEAEAIDLAFMEVSSLLQTEGYAEISPETLKINSVPYTDENVLFAYQKKSVWSVKIKDIELDDKSAVTYEVQIDAVTGEIILVEECR